MSEFELKEGYKKTYDKVKGLTHIYPEEGRSHLFDKCWCSPVTNKKNKTVSHRFSKQNNTVCK